MYFLSQCPSIGNPSSMILLPVFELHVNVITYICVWHVVFIINYSVVLHCIKDIDSTVVRHLTGVYFGAIMNRASVGLFVYVFCSHLCAGVEFLDHTVGMCLVLVNTSCLKVFVPLALPPGNISILFVLCPHPHLVVSVF